MLSPAAMKVVNRTMDRFGLNSSLNPVPHAEPVKVSQITLANVATSPHATVLLNNGVSLDVPCGAYLSAFQVSVVISVVLAPFWLYLEGKPQQSSCRCFLFVLYLNDGNV